jgi:hypothetical protein
MRKIKRRLYVVREFMPSKRGDGCYKRIFYTLEEMTGC